MARRKPLESKKFIAFLLGMISLVGLAATAIVFAASINLYSALVIVAIVFILGFIVVGYVFNQAVLDIYTHGTVDLVSAIGNHAGMERPKADKPKKSSEADFA